MNLMTASNVTGSFFFKSPLKLEVPEIILTAAGKSRLAVVFGASKTDLTVTFMLTGSLTLGALAIVKFISNGVEGLELCIDVPTASGEAVIDA